MLIKFHLAVLNLALLSKASPFPEPTVAHVEFARSLEDSSSSLLVKRTDPVFPPSPPSCTLCSNNYANIQSCSNSCSVFSNPALIIFAPSTFVDVIRCTCTDTFQAVFPQCVDCFQQTNQTQVLNATNLPSVLDGMHQICALSSSLLGGVATGNSQVVGETPITVPSATNAASPSQQRGGYGMIFGAAAALIGAL